MTTYKIALLPGDGIGPEVVAEGKRALEATAERSDFAFDFVEGLIGGAALQEQGDPLPSSTLELCRSSDAVLLGAIGDPRWDTQPAEKRPERGLLGLRQSLQLYANLRPARIYPSLLAASALRSEVVDGTDLLIVRELTGGLYFGEPRSLTGNLAFNTMVYTRHEIERVARFAFETARKRRRKITSVDKANVLEVSQLWRSVVQEVAADYPDVQINHLYVDNAAMQLIRDPRQFDVILTGNLFGDILSDEAAMLTGSLGMLPSASIGNLTAVYEPVHGSAPDIAGKNCANPIATISSCAMLLQHSLGRSQEAERIDRAIAKVLATGYRTKDIATPGTTTVTTREMGELICMTIKGEQI
ncbi:MAG TPA: 3-isopropylmalate dehydrogenase [bacterium]|nr:3-isopropylmalate dehydrogenase [bacterium]HNT64898.1 3-isopropylmalate dehydrogenase [bacterium]